MLEHNLMKRHKKSLVVMKDSVYFPPSRDTNDVQSLILKRELPTNETTGKWGPGDIEKDDLIWLVGAQAFRFSVYIKSQYCRGRCRGPPGILDNAAAPDYTRAQRKKWLPEVAIKYNGGVDKGIYINFSRTKNDP